MPFNGTGTFVRLFNWTNDANNSIPISASRFDGEDNDFAAGLSLCLTRDGQGAPSAPLTWSQPLTIAVASDTTAIAAGRTGGVNNPQLQLKVADATGASINLSTAQTLSATVQGTPASWAIAASGFQITAPSGNRASLFATATYTLGNATDNPNYVLAGSGTLTLPSGGISGTIPGAITVAGIVTAGGFNASAATLPSNGIYLPAANSLGFSVGGVAAGQIASTGAWSLPAPTAGVGLTVNGFAGSYTGVIIGSNTSGQSNGLQIRAGTTTADAAFAIDNQAASAGYFVVWGDGETVVVEPAAGTNATSTVGSSTLHQVGYLDTIANAQSGASYTLVITDRGKAILCSGSMATLTIPANASVAFPVGTTIVVVNEESGSINVAITTDTLTFYPNNLTGTRTLAGRSVMTLYKVAATSWLCWGFGIT